MTDPKIIRHRPRSNGYTGWTNCGRRADKYNIIVTPRLKTADCPECLRLQAQFAARAQQQIDEMLNKPKLGPLRKANDPNWARDKVLIPGRRST